MKILDWYPSSGPTNLTTYVQWTTPTFMAAGSTTDNTNNPSDPCVTDIYVGPYATCGKLAVDNGPGGVEFGLYTGLKSAYGESEAEILNNNTVQPGEFQPDALDHDGEYITTLAGWTYSDAQHYEELIVSGGDDDSRGEETAITSAGSHQNRPASDSRSWNPARGWTLGLQKNPKSGLNSSDE